MSNRARNRSARVPASLPASLSAIVVVLVFGLSSLSSGCQGADSAVARPHPTTPRVRVSAAPVRLARVAKPIRATGSLVDDRRLALGFATGGVVQAVAFEEGMRFQRGAQLARLDLAAIDAQLAQATAGLAKAERDLARVSGLRAGGALAAQSEDDARTGRDVASAQLRGARFARRHAVLVASDDGIVLRRLANAGETLGAGMPVLVVALATSGRVARVGLSDRDVVRLQLGDRAEVTVDAFPGVVLGATVQTLSAAPDPLTGLFDVELALPTLAGLGERAVAGLIVRAAIAPGDGRSLALIPIEALVEANDDRGVVWTLDVANRPARREVRIAFLLGTEVAVSAGLEGVARVVGEGAAYVRKASELELGSIDPAAIDPAAIDAAAARPATADAASLAAARANRSGRVP